jgi:prepilin-type N-terminal cleavage/methylation domain-containing protein
LKRSRQIFDQTQGFTLLEILVAVTLVAMMAVGLWAAMRISITSWQRGTDLIDINQRHRSILDLVKKQMASIYGLVAPINLQMMQMGRLPYPMFWGNDRGVQFISLNSLHFQENPGLTMVAYDIERDRQGAFHLVERETQYLGMEPGRDGLFDSAELTAVEIFENLGSFTFEYYDPGTADRPARWVREWDGREAGRLPTAISMTMIARDSRGGMLSRQLVVPILAKPYDPMLMNFQNPFDSRPRRLREDDPRAR